MPAKGGCGASTIASNFAYQLKRLGDKRILLADLDPLAGTLSFLLKIKSNYSFMDVLARSSEIDADLWKAMVTNRQGVDVLLSPEVMTEGMTELTDASSIIEYARGAYDLVVLDTGSVYGEWNLSQAQIADEILLVTTNELTSLQARAARPQLSGQQQHRPLQDPLDRQSLRSPHRLEQGRHRHCLAHRHLSHPAHRLRSHPESSHGGQAAGRQHATSAKASLDWWIG